MNCKPVVGFNSPPIGPVEGSIGGGDGGSMKGWPVDGSISTPIGVGMNVKGWPVVGSTSPPVWPVPVIGVGICVGGAIIDGAGFGVGCGVGFGAII